MEDYARNQLVLKVERTVMAENTERKVHVWVEEPVYESARHHYLDSLPHGFRRRFLAYFWGIDDTKPLAKRRHHTVTVNRWVKLPEMPPSFGRAYYEQVLDEQSGWA